MSGGKTSNPGSAARERILARVKRATGGGDSVAVAARLGRHLGQTAPTPAEGQTEGAARIDQFIEKTIAADATASRIASLDDLPAALADELRNRNLPAAIRTGYDPAFERDWHRARITQ